jgi:hypothetical protein
VWREHVVATGERKHQAMKVLKPTEADAMAGFLDSKVKPAYMNPATGASKGPRSLFPRRGPPVS